MTKESQRVEELREKIVEYSQEDYLMMHPSDRTLLRTCGQPQKYPYSQKADGIGVLVSVSVPIGKVWVIHEA